MSVARWDPAHRPLGPAGDDVFLRHWLFWVTLGQCVGFLVPALAHLAFAGSPVRVAPMIAAGAVAGAVLGWTQATVLRVRVPRLSRARWVGATTIGAAAAWFIGLLPAEWADVWQRWPAAAQVVGAAVVAVLLLSATGVAQFPELRRHSRSAQWWVVGSAAAGCAGLAVFFAVVTPLWQPGQPGGLVVLIGLTAGLLTALTSALVGGVVLVRLLPVAGSGRSIRQSRPGR